MPNTDASATCNIGETNAGKSLLGTIFEALAVGVAAINAAAAIEMADKQYDIAKDYLNIAKWWRSYYNSAFKPVEDIELEEAKALQEEEPLYDVAIGRAMTAGRIKFRGAAEQAIQCTSEYCTGLREALLKDALNAEATTVAQLGMMGYRQERAYVRAKSDLRWDKRMEVLARGRGMAANNIQFQRLAFGIFGDLGKQAGESAAGAIGYLAYSRNRNETQYPTFTRAKLVQPTATQETVEEYVERSGYRLDKNGDMRPIREIGYEQWNR